MYRARLPRPVLRVTLGYQKALFYHRNKHGNRYGAMKAYSQVSALQGMTTSLLRDGDKFTLKPGMCYLVADDTDAHRSYTKDGVKLLIVD